MARCVSRADLVGRLWANKKYSKTKQEDCVSSTDRHHCPFVARPQILARAFQVCLKDTERSKQFIYESKDQERGLRPIQNQEEAAWAPRRQGRVKLLGTPEETKNNTIPVLSTHKMCRVVEEIELTCARGKNIKRTGS